MADKKTTLIQSSRGSVFSVFGEEELNQITEEGKRKVAVSGKINEPIQNGAYHTECSLS